MLANTDHPIERNGRLNKKEGMNYLTYVKKHSVLQTYFG